MKITKRIFLVCLILALEASSLTAYADQSEELQKAAMIDTSIGPTMDLIETEEKQSSEETAPEEQQSQEESLRVAKIEVASVGGYLPSEGQNIEASETYQIVQSYANLGGQRLNRRLGNVYGPSGKETFYNLNMNGVVNIMRGIGNTDPYWIRSDGVKMLGNYVMVAADLRLRPRGSIVDTSLGKAIVCDTGSFVRRNRQQLDIAVAW